MISIERHREPEHLDVVLRSQTKPYTLFLSTAAPSPYVYRDPTPEDLPLIARAVLEQMTEEQRKEVAGRVSAPVPTCIFDGCDQDAGWERERDEWKARAEHAGSTLRDVRRELEQAGFGDDMAQDRTEASCIRGMAEWKARAEKAERLAATLDACNRACVEPEVHRAAVERARKAEHELAREDVRAACATRERDIARANLDRARAELDRVRPVVEAARRARPDLEHVDQNWRLPAIAGLLAHLRALDKEASDGA
jgi:hypothetical protein